ncbi:hypothetical protein ACJX0J_026586, partial [Zea mays]
FWSEAVDGFKKRLMAKKAMEILAQGFARRSKSSKYSQSRITNEGTLFMEIYQICACFEIQ